MGEFEKAKLKKKKLWEEWNNNNPSEFRNDRTGKVYTDFKELLLELVPEDFHEWIYDSDYFEVDYAGKILEADNDPKHGYTVSLVIHKGWNGLFWGYVESVYGEDYEYADVGIYEGKEIKIIEWSLVD